MKRMLMSLVVVSMLAGTTWAADGAAVYEKKCKMCHSIGGAGGPMAKTGGALDGVGAKHDAAWLKAYVTDPKSKVETSKMPKVSLGTEDLDAVVAYLATLK